MITQNQLIQVAKLSKPLTDWLKANCHPHMKIEITSERVEILEGIASSPLKEERNENANS